MSNTISETLNRIFSNPNFMREIVMCQNMDYIEAIALVLEYYIVTRDTNTHYSFSKIQELYDKFLEEHIREAIDNTIKHGFLAHAFNGYKKERMINYGPDYENKPELKKEIEYGRQLLNELEELLGKSFFTINEEMNNREECIRENTIFMCSPGKEVVEYALNASPERLFLGPLSGAIGAIVGETKAQYYYRLLEDKLCKEYKETDPEKYEKGLELARKAVDYFCTKRPCIALIEIDKILDVRFYKSWISCLNITDIYMRDVVTDDFYINSGKKCISNFFEDDFKDKRFKRLFDLVTLSRNIPREAVSVFEVMDFFELFQLEAKERGFGIGTKFNGYDRHRRIDNKNCSIATIGELGNIAENLTSIDDLEKLKEQVSNRKKIILNELDGLKTKLGEYGVTFNNVQELKYAYEDIEKKEKEILDSPFQHKEGITQQESLKKVIERLKSNGQLDVILREDSIIKDDKYQYDNELHGVNHTRRVAFYLYLISEKGRLIPGEREILFDVVFNHDIGIKDDWDDSEHGELSVDKMMKLEKQGEERFKYSNNSKDKAIARFIIKHHSLDTISSRLDIKELRRIQEKKRYLKRLLLLLRKENITENDVSEFRLYKINNYNSDSSDYSYELDKLYNLIDYVDLENLGEDQLRAIRIKARIEFKRLYEKYPVSIKYAYNIEPQIERLLEIFIDANELDKVRLSPDGSNQEKGLNSKRVVFDDIRSLEGLAYECYDKLIEVLDAEHAKKEMERCLEIYNELQEEPETESKINSQIEKSRGKNTDIIKKLVNQKFQGTTSLSFPNSLPNLPSSLKGVKANDYGTEFFE